MVARALRGSVVGQGPDRDLAARRRAAAGAGLAATSCGLAAALAERLRNWAFAEAVPGRLLPWLPVAFGFGIAIYFTAEREPAGGRRSR